MMQITGESLRISNTTPCIILRNREHGIVRMYREERRGPTNCGFAVAEGAEADKSISIRASILPLWEWTEAPRGTYSRYGDCVVLCGRDVEILPTCCILISQQGKIRYNQSVPMIMQPIWPYLSCSLYSPILTGRCKLLCFFHSYNVLACSIQGCSSLLQRSHYQKRPLKSRPS